MRSSLAGRVIKAPTTEPEMRAMRAKAWHEHDVLVVPLCEITDDFERQFLINIGARLYGSRQREI